MITGLLSIFAVLKPFLAPLLAFLAGWLFPSPLQKAIDQQGMVHDVEKQATDSAGDVGGLDHLP